LEKRGAVPAGKQRWRGNKTEENDIERTRALESRPKAKEGTEETGEGEE
jgi:hypothetical protein